MKITVPLIRDLTMLMLGAGVLIREFFLIGNTPPDRLRVYAGFLLLMGPTFILGFWQAWVALKQPPGAASHAPTPTVEPSSSPPSSSPSQRS